MSPNIKHFFIFVVLITPSFSARILAVVPTPSYSHQVAFYPLWKELSLRGHQVTLLTTDPINDPSLKNLTEIDLSFSYKEADKIELNKFAELNLFKALKALVKLGYDLLDEQLQHPDVRNLIKDENQRFDVALIEGFFSATLAYAERFKCPLIQVYSYGQDIIGFHTIGNPVHPVLNPDGMLTFFGKLTFIERLVSTLYRWNIVFFYKYYFFPSQQKIIEKHFGSGYPAIEQIISGTSLMFVNLDDVLHSPKPLQPNIIQIGGGAHVTMSKQLPKDLQRVLDDASNGFIYFSFGSNIKSNLLSENMRKILLETFSKLPYTVLWKFEEDNMPGKPDNVIISKWFPQRDIFRHPNIKLFISQAGAQSLDEAVHNHVPMIGIPFVFDQEYNAKRMEQKGIGLRLEKYTLTQTTLKEAILEVINNPKYRNRVKELADLIRDQPMTGLERAVWWTEYVIRHKGAKHLRSPALDLPTYQYFLLDVIGFVLLVISIVVYLSIKVVKLILKIISYLLYKRKIKIE